MAEDKKDNVGLTQDEYNSAMVNIFTKMQESLEAISNTMERQLELDENALRESIEAMKEEQKWRDEKGADVFNVPTSYRTDIDKDKNN